MSRDVIKASSFSALFAETSEPTTAQRFTSSRVRFRELLERLEQAEAREQRAVANAVERTRAEVEAEAQAKWGEATQALESVVRRVQELTEVEYEVAVEELVDLATSIASKIVRREIAKDDEYVVKLVRRSLRRMGGAHDVTVRLNPEDLEAVKAARADLVGDGSAGQRIRFEGDRRVEQGGCLVETPDFVVDGQTRTQLQRAREALGGAS